MFLTTANSLDIPGPLLDRMEVIHLSGYTEDEKVQIAIRHLLAKQIKDNGLKPDEIEIKEEVIHDIIRYYTREAGVRNLERNIGSLCRKVVKEILLKTKNDKPTKGKGKAKKLKITLTSKNLPNYLGVRKYSFGEKEKKDQIGLVTGLAWTSVGGDILHIEAAVLEGNGKAMITGNLKEVMKESITAANSYVRSRCADFGIDPEFYKNKDIHIHVPDAATPKDGPSAGVGMVTAMVSALTNTPIRSEVAMTGEVNLRGQVMPIGGLKEKLLAAHRGGIKKVLIPMENKKDLEEIPKNILEKLEVVPIEFVDDILKHALTKMPSAKKVKGKVKADPKKKNSSKELSH
jgi:ATP-dependent Lon protease